MTNRSIVPINQLSQRLPEQGRIRLGVKTGKAMKSIDTFRFTSADEAAIRNIAERYGGTAKPWSDPKANPREQFEVITRSAEIRVLLPPDSISTWYEMWSAGGCIRRCDGVTVQVPGRDQMDEAPCICVAQKALACKPHTRLTVVLPDITPFGGGWRLETKGWNVAHEMPEMARLIETLQAQGLAEAKLILSKESDVVTRGGKAQTRHWVEPKLLVPQSADAIMAGASRAQALGAGDMKELPSETSTEAEPEVDVIGQGEDWFEADEEIIDAEIVEEEPTATPVAAPKAAAPAPDPAPPTSGDTATVSPAAFKKINALVKEVATTFHKGKPTTEQLDTIRHAIAWYSSGKATESSRELSSAGVTKAIDTLERCKEQQAWLGKLLEKYGARPF